SPHTLTHPPTPLSHALSLHDALPIFSPTRSQCRLRAAAQPGQDLVGGLVGRSLLGQPLRQLRIVVEQPPGLVARGLPDQVRRLRSEEHTSELQSRENLVCRLLLEKKK